MFGYNAVGGSIAINNENISGNSAWNSPGRGAVTIGSGTGPYFIEVDGPNGGYVYLDGESMQIIGKVGGTLPLEVVYPTTSAAPLLRIRTIANRVLCLLDAHGSLQLDGSAGINGVEPPEYPVLATGVDATTDDVIGLLQSYGLCKQS